MQVDEEGKGAAAEAGSGTSETRAGAKAKAEAGAAAAAAKPERRQKGPAKAAAKRARTDGGENRAAPVALLRQHRARHRLALRGEGRRLAARAVGADPARAALIGHLRRVGIADRAAVAQAAVDRRDADGNIGGLAAAQRDGQLRPLGEGQPAGECQDAAYPQKPFVVS